VILLTSISIIIVILFIYLII